MSDFSKKMIILASVLVLVGVAIYVFFMSPIYEAKTINVSGNQMMTDEEVIKSLGIKTGDNLLLMMIKDVFENEKTVSELDPRLQTADISYSDNNTIEVVVTETALVGYLYYQGTYLWLNSSGLVIYSGAPDVEKGLIAPFLEGIQVTEFQSGGMVNDDVKASFNAVNQILSAFKKYGLKDDIVAINVADIENITVYYEGLEIRLGGTGQSINGKANIVSEFLEEYTDAKGILHIEDLNGQIYLEQTND